VKKHVVVALALVVVMGTAGAHAQQPVKPPASAPAPAPEIVPLEIDVTVSRFDGEKKISSQPYVLNVNATPNAVVNGSPMTVVKIGSQVPVPNFAPPSGPDGKATPGVAGGGPVVFREVGTQIDCRARPLPEGRFELMLGVQESSVMPPDQAPRSATDIGLPVLKTFQVTNTLILRDGQRRQFAAATDPVNGQVVKIEVTLKVVK
jgi:hypothetical protein